MNETKLREAIAPVVQDAALELEAIDVIPAGKRRLVRITLDGEGPAGRGPSLDEITSATRAISAMLDESTVTGDRPYTLEVSSRGTSRPLTEPKHWRRNRDRLVKVVLASDESLKGRASDESLKGGASEESLKGGARDESIEGRIAETDRDGVTLTIAGAKKQPDTQRRLTWAEIRSAVIQVELNRKDIPTGADADTDTDDEETE